jgi:hypothetical protein
MTIGTLVGIVSGKHKGLRGYATHDRDHEWQVLPLGGGPPITCTTSEMRVVPTTWLKEVNCRRYDKHSIMVLFEGPGLSAAVTSLETFTSCSHPPGTDAVLSWWGPKTFLVMYEKLQTMLHHIQRSPQELGYFRDEQVRCGIVFSDGDKNTQLTPRAKPMAYFQQWWPALFVARNGSGEDQFVAVLCQAQALSGSRPWKTDRGRVVCLRKATQALLGRQQPMPPPPPPMPYDYEASTVVIEEINEDDSEVIEEQILELLDEMD